jgi:hypothetical protein
VQVLVDETTLQTVLQDWRQDEDQQEQLGATAGCTAASQLLPATQQPSPATPVQVPELDAACIGLQPTWLRHKATLTVPSSREDTDSSPCCGVQVPVVSPAGAALLQSQRTAAPRALMSCAASRGIAVNAVNHAGMLVAPAGMHHSRGRPPLLDEVLGMANSLDGAAAILSPRCAVSRAGAMHAHGADSLALTLPSAAPMPSRLQRPQIATLTIRPAQYDPATPRCVAQASLQDITSIPERGRAHYVEQLQQLQGVRLGGTATLCSFRDGGTSSLNGHAGQLAQSSKGPPLGGADDALAALLPASAFPDRRLRGAIASSGVAGLCIRVTGSAAGGITDSVASDSGGANIGTINGAPNNMQYTAAGVAATSGEVAATASETGYSCSAHSKHGGLGISNAEHTGWPTALAVDGDCPFNPMLASLAHVRVRRLQRAPHVAAQNGGDTVCGADEECCAGIGIAAAGRSAGTGKIDCSPSAAVQQQQQEGSRLVAAATLVVAAAGQHAAADASSSKAGHHAASNSSCGAGVRNGLSGTNGAQQLHLHAATGTSTSGAVNLGPESTERIILANVFKITPSQSVCTDEGSSTGEAAMALPTMPRSQETVTLIRYTAPPQQQQQQQQQHLPGQQENAHGTSPLPAHTPLMADSALLASATGRRVVVSVAAYRVGAYRLKGVDGLVHVGCLLPASLEARLSLLSRSSAPAASQV